MINDPRRDYGVATTTHYEPHFHTTLYTCRGGGEGNLEVNKDIFVSWFPYNSLRACVIQTLYISTLISSLSTRTNYQPPTQRSQSSIITTLLPTTHSEESVLYHNDLVTNHPLRQRSQPSIITTLLPTTYSDRGVSPLS